jgi:homoserine O-acetyltransferase/O-succinyltransferase
MTILKHNEPFVTESGATLPELEIAYSTWGRLNEKRDNVIWVCHAYTANSDVESWWPGMLGDEMVFDTRKYFVVCANILGSCYGTTGPLSINPATSKPWLNDFPVITIRDIVRVLEILRAHLKISMIDTIIGSSIGGFQALEYGILYPDQVKRLILIASNAKQSPWSIAFNESQRLAIEADSTFFGDDINGGQKGLKAARSMALLSYRTPYAYNQTQAEETDDKLTSFRASSYQAYQGDKLVKRFNPWTYYRLTQLSDNHNVGRGRGGVLAALKLVKAYTLCIGITSDILFPVNEQKFLAENIEKGSYAEIDSFYGHDGFLIEAGQVSAAIKKFWEDTSHK